MSKTKEFTNTLPKGSPVTIGIDQSLTGFAVSAVSTIEPDKHITWVFKSDYRGVQRLKDIQHWLIGTFTNLQNNGHKIVDLAMEGTVLASQSALVLGELAAVVKLTCWEHFLLETPQMTPLQIPPMTLKKYAAGKGNAKKQEMLLQIYKRFGLEFNDDNAADAYALARLAGGHVLNDVDKQIVEQIKDPKYRDTIF